MGKKKLRYNGFSFMARCIWAIENLESPSYISFREIIERIDKAGIWTDDLPPSTKKMFKQLAGKYMASQQFQKELLRNEVRKYFSDKGLNNIPKEKFEKPEDWFSNKILAPTKWLTVLNIVEMIRIKESTAEIMRKNKKERDFQKNEALERQLNKKQEENAGKALEWKLNKKLKENDLTQEFEILNIGSESDEEWHHFLECSSLSSKE